MKLTEEEYLKKIEILEKQLEILKELKPKRTRSQNPIRVHKNGERWTVIDHSCGNSRKGSYPTKEIAEEVCEALLKYRELILEEDIINMICSKHKLKPERNPIIPNISKRYENNKIRYFVQKKDEKGNIIINKSFTDSFMKAYYFKKIMERNHWNTAIADEMRELVNKLIKD